MLLLRRLNSPGQILYFAFPIVNIVLYLSTQIVRTKMSVKILPGFKDDVLSLLFIICIMKKYDLTSNNA